MTAELNYKHLYYFWVAAKEGGMSHAAARLGMAVQTVSAQVRLLEQSLGHALFKPAGRGLVLTEAGQTALKLAEQIFLIGEQLPAAVRDAATQHAVRLVVGISDGLPKLAVRDLLEPVMDEPHLRLMCHEDEFDDLLADLALHRLDVVLTDRPAPGGSNLKLFSTQLGDFATGLFAREELAKRHAANFPASLDAAPLLLPSRHHALRARIDRWLENLQQEYKVRPRIVGEFEDNALLNTFGRGGLGLFPAPLALAAQVSQQLNALRIGEMQGVSEQIYAISSERRIRHPAVEALCQVKIA